MFQKLLIKKSSQPILNIEKLQKLVMELDEHKQESISGGGFPCDGPGRGGTCAGFSWGP